MQSEDIIIALKDMKVLDPEKKADADMVVNKAKVRQWMESNKVQAIEPVAPRCFVVREYEGDDEEK